MSKYGPNMTKLITKFIPRHAVPPGGGIQNGINFFIDPEYRKNVLAKSENDALTAIKLIMSAPDNPYGADQETVAQAIIEEIEKRMKQK